MRFIITGGTGLIGSALSKRLLQEDTEIIILSRKPKKYSKKIDKRIRLVKWDGLTGEGWYDLINKDTVIVNLAGANIANKRWSKKRKKLLLDSRVNAGKAVVDAIEKADEKPAVLLQASAIGFYDYSDTRDITEDDPPGKGFLPEIVTLWEESTDGVEALGVRRIVTRIGLVLSTEGGALKKMLPMFKFFVAGPFGNGEQWYSWIHIEDLVSAFLYLIEKPESKGAYNLTAPNPVKNKDFVKLIGKVMGRPVWMKYPSFLLRIMLGEMATTLVNGQKVLPKRLLSEGFQFKFPTLIEALNDLLSNK